MSEEILNPEEVDFLLGGSDEGEISFISKEVQEVTMRGDLEQMCLADVFQTLSMAKMEGVLRVKNPLEAREVFFRDGRCRCIPPVRTETRRLGQFLIRAGFITPDELRTALVEQKQRKIPIGQVLVEQGLVPADQLEELAVGQFTEDLFALFTWQRGSFEFYKGGIADEVHRARMERLPEFEVGSLLLEVARRTDEWSGILKAVGNLEEVPAVSPLTEGLAQLPIEQVHHTVLEAVNGRLTFRDLGDSTMLGLFATARACRDLFQWGVLEIISCEEMLEVAEHWVAEDEIKRAVATIQTLYERQENESTDTVRAMAEVLRHCGEGRLAAGLLLEHTQCLGDPEQAIELVRIARDIHGRDREVLTALDQLLRESPHNLEERQSVLVELVDVCLADHVLDEAVRCIEELEDTGAAPESVLPRKAIIQAKQRQPKAAIATYEELIEFYLEKGDRKHLADVYERILKLDHERRDIARALRSLKTSRSAKIKRWSAVGVGIAAVAWFSWSYWADSQREAALLALDAQVRAMVHDSDLARANSAILEAAETWGADDPGVVALFQLVESSRNNKLSSAAQADQRRYLDGLAQAANSLEKGELESALELYTKLLDENPTRRKEILEAVSVRLSSVQSDFDDKLRSLPFRIPAAPTATTKRSEIEAGLQAIRTHFPAALLRSVDGVAALSDKPELEQLIGAEPAAAIIQSATKLRAVIGTASVRLAQFEEAADNAAISAQLNPVFLAAREHEKQHEFTAARDAYRQLATAALPDPGLVEHFRERLAHFELICKHMELLQQATEAGNYEMARTQLRTLRSKVSDVPFSTLVELPIHVVSQPAGAQVVLDGVAVATTPTIVRFRPSAETSLEVKLPGFVTEGMLLAGEGAGRFECFLARTPAWSRQAPGAIDRSAVAGPSGNAFVVDRAGSCSAVALATGETEWSHQTKDLSGLLPRPALADGLVVLTSIDGPVRCLDQKTGNARWTVRNMPSAVGPAVIRGAVVLGTKDELVCLDLGTGSELWRRGFGSEIVGDVQSLDSLALVTTRDGRVVAVQAASGADAWSRVVRPGLAGWPTLTARGIAVVVDDGSVTMLDPRSGTVVWQREELGELPHRAAADSQLLFLSRHEGMLALDLGSGATVSRLERTGLCSPPTLAGTRVLVAVNDGNILVLEPSTLAILYRLHTRDRVLTEGTVTDEGRIMLTAESGLLLGFDRLP